MKAPGGGGDKLTVTTSDPLDGQWSLVKRPTWSRLGYP